MLIKAIKLGNKIQLFDTFIGLIATINETTWEIIKSLKEYGKEKSVKIISDLFETDEKTAREDINDVITNLENLGIKIKHISLSLTKEKYSPRSVEFLITQECNCNCIYCQSSDTRKNQINLSTEKIKEVLTDLVKLGNWCVWLECYGVLLRKDIFEILDHAKKIETAIVLFINGILVTEEIAKKFSSYENLRIQIIIDSYIPEHHDLQRGVKGCFQKTIKAIEILKKYNITPHIGMIITKYNINDIDKTIDLVYGLGIKYMFIGPTAYFTGRAYENKDKLILSRDEVIKIKSAINNAQKKYEGKMSISLST